MRFKGNAIRSVAVVSCALGLVIGAQGSASAAVETIRVYSGNGDLFGHGQWNDDPTGSVPGDSIRACDSRSDGLFIEVGLDTDQDGFADDRKATTRGLTAGSCSPWKSGDLKEGETYTIWVWVMSSDGSNHGARRYDAHT